MKARTVAAVAAAIAIAVTGCSSKATPAATAQAVDREAQLAQFEKDNNIKAGDWDGAVTSREVKLNSVWVHTKLSETQAAKEVAARICGAYAQFVTVDPKVTVTYIRAASEVQLAKCGPGA